MMWLRRLKPEDKQRAYEIVNSLPQGRRIHYKNEKPISLESSVASLHGWTESYENKNFLEDIFNKLRNNNYYDKATQNKNVAPSYAEAC